MLFYDYAIYHFYHTYTNILNYYLIDEFFLYDTETKIVYVLLNGDVDSGITPYYVLDENGKPEIAIYGENYSG